MTEDPVCCVPDTPLSRVARLMAENNCGAIPVIAGPEDRSPVGIITDRDVAVRTVALGRNPLGMTAGEIMTGEPVTIGPGDSLEECASLMRLHQLRRIMVVDGRGRVCGLVVQSQIARHLPKDVSGETVRDISKPPQDS
jgi:CBS domain-containing protein